MHGMMAAVDDVLDEMGPGTGRASSPSTRWTCSTTSTGGRCRSASPTRFQVSGATGEGVDELRDAIEARFLATLRPMELLVPYDEGGRLSELHDLAGELEREDTPEGVRISARVPVSAAQRFERFERNGDSPG